VKDVEQLIDKAYLEIENCQSDDLLDNNLKKAIIRVVFTHVNGLIFNKNAYESEDLKTLKEKYGKNLPSMENSEVECVKKNSVNFNRVSKAKVDHDLLSRSINALPFEKIPVESSLVEWRRYDEFNYIPFNIRNDKNEYRLVREKKGSLGRASAFYPFLPKMVLWILTVVEAIFCVLDKIGLVMCAILYGVLWVCTKLVKCFVGLTPIQWILTIRPLLWLTENATKDLFASGENIKKNEDYFVTEEIKDENDEYTKDVDITKSFKPLENKEQKDYENDPQKWEISWAEEKTKANKDDKGLSFRRYCRRFGFFRKDAKLINRRYKNFSDSFNYYSQRERIVGMSYNRTLFAQAFDNDGSVDEDYIRNHFKIAKPYLFRDALYFMCYEGRNAKDVLNEAVNVDIDVNTFLTDENEEEEEDCSLSKRVVQKPQKVSSFSVYKDLKKMDSFVNVNKSSGNELALSMYPTKHGQTVELETIAQAQPSNVIHVNINEKYIEKLVNETKVSEKKNLTKVGKTETEPMPLFLFLDEIDQDLRGDVTLSEGQREVFMYYLMKYHGFFNRVLFVIENCAIISVLVMLIFWSVIPQMVSVIAGVFVDDVSVGAEVGFAILIFVVVFIVVTVVYSVLFIIVLCWKGVKIENIKKTLK
jgi:hypothetical protein